MMGRRVKCARMRYMLPRLSTFMTTGAGMDAKGGGASSGGGGQFLKGSGESQLESDRRLFRKQIGRIEAEMEEVRARNTKKSLISDIWEKWGRHIWGKGCWRFWDLKTRGA